MELVWFLLHKNSNWYKFIVSRKRQIQRQILQCNMMHVIISEDLTGYSGRVRRQCLNLPQSSQGGGRLQLMPEWSPQHEQVFSRVGWEIEVGAGEVHFFFGKFKHLSKLGSNSNKWVLILGSHWVMNNFLCPVENLVLYHKGNHWRIEGT